MARLMDSVIGHREVWTTPTRQLELGRIPHALAFTGLAGIGKMRVAWAFAQALVCENPPGPCGQCPSCLRIEKQQSESVLLIEPENSVIKLEATQQVLNFLALRRLGRARVVLINEAQCLNPQGANALLKVIEEPPEQTFFIMVVSELSQLLPTLRSRVQVVRFSPLIDAQIRSQVEASANLPEWMLHSARGSFAQLEIFRDAEWEELRGVLFDFLAQSLNRQRSGLTALLDRSKERSVAQRLIQLLQQILRDWSVLDVGDVIHSDLKSRLLALPNIDRARRLELWRSALRMEQDLAAHVDRSLLFENFYYQAQGAVG